MDDDEGISLVEVAAREAALARDDLLLAVAERVAQVDQRLYRPLARYRSRREDWDELRRRLEASQAL